MGEGLKRIVKLYGSAMIGGKRWVWDYANDVAVLEAEMPIGSKRHADSEAIKYSAILRAAKKED